MLSNVGSIISSKFNLEKISVIDLSNNEPRSISFNEINKLSDAVARSLTSKKINIGDRVAILSDNSVEMIVTFFGSMRLGAVPILINTKLSNSQIEHILTESKSKILFSDRNYNFNLESINIKNNFEHFLDFGNFNCYVPEKDDVAFILYTSGSSGDPKGTLITHRGHLWAIDRIINYDKKASTRVSLISAPLYHSNGLTTLIGSIAGQATVVLLPTFDSMQCIKAIETYHIDTIYCVPSMVAMMVQHDYFKQADLSSLRQIRSASAHFSQKLVETISYYLPNVNILNSYGITEVGPALFGPHPEGIPRPTSSVGYPAQGIQYRIIDGILQIKSPSIMKSYHEVTDDRVFTEDGFFITKDLFQVDSNGFYYFLGRCDDMFKCGGNRVYPKKIEETLENHPAVLSAAVIGIEDDIKGHKPYAFIIIKKNSSISEQELKHHVLDQLSPYCYPRKIWFVDEFPMLGSNKIDRQKLKQIALQDIAVK